MMFDMYSQSHMNTDSKTKPKQHIMTHMRLNTGDPCTYYNMKTYTPAQQRQCALFSTSRLLSQGLG